MEGGEKKGCKDRITSYFHVRQERERERRGGRGRRREKERKERRGKKAAQCQTISKVPSKADCIKGISQVKQSPNRQGCEREQTKRGSNLPSFCVG